MLHINDQYCIIVLPLVEPRHLKAYARICKRSDSGNAIVADESVPSLLLELPSITGYGKSVKATFPGTIRFARLGFGNIAEEESDNRAESNGNMVNVDEFLMEKMNKDLPPVDLEEPFCWQAYKYATVSFKIIGASLSGASIDPKSNSIYPPVKAPVEFSTQVTSGDYILWNTLGKCPSAASRKS